MAYISMEDPLSQVMSFETKMNALKARMENLAAKYPTTSYGLYAQWRLWDFKRHPYFGGQRGSEQSKDLQREFEEWIKKAGPVLRTLDSDPLWKSYFNSQRVDYLSKEHNMDACIDFYRAEWCFETHQSQKAKEILGEIERKYKGTQYENSALQMKMTYEHVGAEAPKN